MEKFETTQVFNSIYKKLEEMENKGKIDLTILEEFDLLAKKFKAIELFWVENKRVNVEDAFLLYHCARNCRTILTRMRNRFLEAEKKHLNPDVAIDSLQIIPVLNALYEIVTVPVEKSLNKEQQMHIIQRLKEMRNIAASLSFLPTFQEETENINMIKLKKHFKELAESLEASYFEE